MAKSTANGDTFSTEERAAIKARAAELKSEAKRAGAAQKAAAEQADVLAKIAQMPEADQKVAKRLHTIVETVAPQLSPKLYYGQPGYAHAGKVVCFFRSGLMDKSRYSTFGFSVHAELDTPDGFWPTSYALHDPTEEAWERISDLIRQATHGLGGH